MIDHAARLDDDGYHIVKPAKKAYAEANFVGETRLVHDDDDGHSFSTTPLHLFLGLSLEQEWLLEWELKQMDAAAKRVVCRAVAGPSAVAAPPPRADPAVCGGRVSRPAGAAGRNRRRTRAPEDNYVRGL